MQRSSRGYSGEDALARGKLSAGGIGLLVGNGDDLVINALVKRLGDKVCAYSLKPMGACVTFRQQRRGLRLNGDYFDALIAAFEVLPNAAYGIKKSDEGIAILQLPDNRIHGATAGLTRHRK